MDRETHIALLILGCKAPCGYWRESEGVSVFLSDTIYGKNRAVYQASLKHKSPTLRFLDPAQNR
jgi:hypothetical protein